MVTDKSFRGLADPVRRLILVFLGRESLNVARLAARFDISRPAISRHLRVLRESGLVEEFRRGRERVYSLRPERIQATAEWLRALAEGEAQREEEQTVETSDASAPEDADWRQW